MKLRNVDAHGGYTSPASPEPATIEQIQSPRDAASGQSGAANTDNYNPKELSVDKIRSPRDPASGQASSATERSKSQNRLGNFEIQDVKAPQDQTAPEAQAGYFTNVMVTSVVAPKPDAQTAQSEAFTAAEGRSMSFERNAAGSRQGQSDSKPTKWTVPDLDSDQSGMVRNSGTGGQSANQSSGIAKGRPPAANLPEVGDEVLVSLANGSGSGNPAQEPFGDTQMNGRRGQRQDIEVENDETHVVAHGSARTGSSPTATYIGETEKNIDQAGASPSDKFIGGSKGAGAGNVGQFAESGRKAEEMIVGNPEVGTETVCEGGVNDTTFRKKQPRRDRNGTRGKRQHKP